jgi:hypothetical protein
MERRNYSRDLQVAEWGRTVILRSNNPHDWMSALGQKRTFPRVGPMSALPPKANIGELLCDVRLVPKADIASVYYG